MKMNRNMHSNSGKGLLRDRRGAVGAWSALMLVMLLGVAALTLDMGFLWVLRDRLQSTADAAALAGASQLTTTPDPALVKAESVAYAQKNMSTGAHGTVLADADVVLGHWHGKDHHAPGDPDLRTFIPKGTPNGTPKGTTGGPGPPGQACSNPVPSIKNKNCLSTNAVQVTTRRAEANGNAASLFLASVLGIQKADVVTEATAVGINNSGFACLLALHDGSRAMVFEGDETLALPGCSIQVNSADPNAVEIDPTTPDVTVDSFCVTGGIAGDTSGIFQPPKTGNADCPPVPDPFASVDEPVVGACTENNFNVTGGAPTLDPGVYCGGLNIANSADVTFSPGTYIIKDGTFNVDGTSSVTGAGVTFFLTGGNTTFVNFDKDTQVDLSAPTTGPLFGLVFFGERNAFPNLTHHIGSNAHMRIEGTAYFPDGKIKIVSRIGGGESTSPYTAMIAQKFRFSTNAAMHVTAASGGTFSPGVYITLVW